MLLKIWIVLMVGNVLWGWWFGSPWLLALERSYFQGTALLIAKVVQG